MKIIDLLNKIANGEELPKKIKFNHIEYHLVDDYYVDDGDGDLFIYIFKHNIDFSVNDEVEILDDEYMRIMKKPNIYDITTLEINEVSFKKNKDMIIKSSSNIIDLIEVGDIVINQLDEIIRITSGNIDELKDYWKICENPIKSIVTKDTIYRNRRKGE